MTQAPPPPCLHANHGRAQRARKAVDAYQGETGLSGEPFEQVLRCLIADLGHLAAQEGADFVPIIAHAEAYWLQESARAKERGRR